MKALYLVLKREPFKAIASGEKRIEYRNATSYWRNRLKKPFTTVLFQLGYERSAPRLLADIESISLIENCYEIVISNPKDESKIPLCCPSLSV